MKWVGMVLKGRAVREEDVLEMESRCGCSVVIVVVEGMLVIATRRGGKLVDGPNPGCVKSLETFFEISFPVRVVYVVTGVHDETNIPRSRPHSRSRLFAHHISLLTSANCLQASWQRR
jgi:hypothetical protein